MGPICRNFEYAKILDPGSKSVQFEWQVLCLLVDLSVAQQKTDFSFWNAVDMIGNIEIEEPWKDFVGDEVSIS